MTKYLWAYAGSAGVFVLGDFIWLGFVARNFYKEQLGFLMLDRPLMGVAVGFYALYLVGLVIFGVSPGLRDGSWKMALLYGALFGLFCYATYDLTNLSTLANFPAKLSNAAPTRAKPCSASRVSAETFAESSPAEIVT